MCNTIDSGNAVQVSNKKVFVFIVNGRPSAGKTTFEEMVKEKIQAECTVESTVGVAKNIYSMLGWDGTKTDEHRANISKIKEMYVNNCNGPTRDIVRRVLSIANNISRHDHVVFVDCREQEEIDKLYTALNGLSIIGISISRVLVLRNGADNIRHGNVSDDGVMDKSKYDHIIMNDEGLVRLNSEVTRFIEKYGIGYGGGNK